MATEVRACPRLARPSSLLGWGNPEFQTLPACLPGEATLAPRRVDRILDLYDPRTASMRAGSEFVRLLDRVAAAAARAEALPQGALRQAHPRERCLEDVRLAQARAHAWVLGQRVRCIMLDTPGKVAPQRVCACMAWSQALTHRGWCAARSLHAVHARPSAHCGTCRCATFAGASEAGLKRHTCSACHTARYCGPRCQKAAWGAHRAACRRRQAPPG